MKQTGLDGKSYQVCDVCAQVLPERGPDGRGRLQRFCSAACKQKAYRRRKLRDYGSSPLRKQFEAIDSFIQSSALLRKNV